MSSNVTPPDNIERRSSYVALRLGVGQGELSSNVTLLTDNERTRKCVRYTLSFPLLRRTVSRIAAGGVPIALASRSYPCSVLLLLPPAKVRRRNRMCSSRYRTFELLLIGSIRDSNCNGCKSALSAAMVVRVVAVTHTN